MARRKNPAALDINENALRRQFMVDIDTYSIIENDRIVFGKLEKDIKKGDTHNDYSTFINNIIEKFLLMNKHDPENNPMITLEELDSIKREHGEKLRLRLRQDVYLKLGRIAEGFHGEYTISSLVRCILKTRYTCYAALCRREEIYFYDWFSEVEDAISSYSVLALTLRKKQPKSNITESVGNSKDDENEENVVVRMIPFYIKPDTLATYNYVVGLRIERDDDLSGDIDVEKAATSHRISNLERCPVQLRSGFDSTLIKQIKAAKHDDLLEIEKKRTVQFMQSQTESIRIKLTKRGIGKYNQMLHLRPHYTERSNAQEDGSRVYTFDCTDAQAEFYFFKFGADAKILEPEKLAEKFRDMHQKAAELYDENYIFNV